jgi:hypothetical protein
MGGRSVVVVVVGVGLVCAAAGAIFGSTPSPATLTACANAKGVLRLVPPGAPCGAAETLVTWAITGPPGPPGLPGAPGAGLKLVDSEGRLVAFSSPPGFVRLVDGIWVIFSVNSEGFVCCSGLRLWYESADCTGAGYQPAGSSDALFSSESGSVGTVRYFPSLTDGVTRTLNSAKSFGPTGIEGECQLEVRTQNVELPLTVDVSEFGLVPPFRLSE